MKKFWNIIVPHGQVLKNVINGGYMKSSPTTDFEQCTKLSWAIFYIPC
jgi:hypothetical protein